MMKTLEKIDPKMMEILRRELDREQSTLVLIASENYASRTVLEVQGCLMTNKYAEGYPGERYYHGCQWIDEAESLAIERAKKLFGAEHVNVQPHSGSQANMAAYYALLEPGDTILAMRRNHGGHVTHGGKGNFSSRYYNPVFYGVDKSSEMIDYDEVSRLAKEHKPRMIIVGASAYPRVIDFKRWREIADEVGACLLADVAHIVGLIAAGLHPDPVPYCDVVTTTTHKTLRGPRGAMIMCKKEYAKRIDRAVFPGNQAGPLMHVIAAKAVAFAEAMKPEFKEYQKRIIKNAKALAEGLKREGFRLVSGGTDNHLMLVDLTERGLTGKEAADILDEAGITLNKNTIPFDKKSPSITSGIRLGTPAVTTRGMKEAEMESIAKMVSNILNSPDDQDLRKRVKEKVKNLCRKFPIYSDL